MGYALEISEKLEKTLKKLKKKNRNQFAIIHKKVEEILKNPERYKPLRGDMHGVRRVHIDKHFVLIYEVHAKVVRLLEYAHHDEAYT